MVLGTLGVIVIGMRALHIPHGKGGVQAAIAWLSDDGTPKWLAARLSYAVAALRQFWSDQATIATALKRVANSPRGRGLPDRRLFYT
jgi:hypothetical protein